MNRIGHDVFDAQRVAVFAGRETRLMERNASAAARNDGAINPVVTKTPAQGFASWRLIQASVSSRGVWSFGAEAKKSRSSGETE